MKQLHGQALKTFEKKSDLKELKSNLIYLITEWDKIIQRPYREPSILERELATVIRLQQIQAENEWLSQHS